VICASNIIQIQKVEGNREIVAVFLDDLCYKHSALQHVPLIKYNLMQPLSTLLSDGGTNAPPSSIRHDLTQEESQPRH
jgi:hypothetical protein